MQQAQKEDISKSIILVLVVLTVLISVLSTWSVFDAMSQVKSTGGYSNGATQGEVQLRIVDSNAPVGNVVSEGFASGKVQLTISNGG